MKKIYFRILVLLGIFALFGYFIAKNLTVIRATYQTTASNITGFLLLALLLTVLIRWCIGKMLQECFDVVGMKRKAVKMFALELQALAVNLIVPTAGVSVAVLFANEAKKNNESQTAAVNGALLTYLVDYTAISSLLLLAFLFLYLIHSLTPSVVIPAIFFFILTGSLYLLSFLAIKGSAFLERVLIKLAKIFVIPVLNFFKKNIRVTESVKTFIKELSDASKAATRDPKSILKAFGWSIASHFLRIIMLYVIFASLGYEPLYRVILAGYAIGALFVVVSPTPNGVGFVEGSMALVFSGLGVPGAVATTATIIYRAFDFWIPFAVGFFLLQRSNVKMIREEIFGG